MKILDESINKSDLDNCDCVFEGPMVKGVVDVATDTLAIDSELHADLEKLLLEEGHKQQNLWGINLWYEDDDEDFVEFDSLINIRPQQNNPGRDVSDEDIQNKIIEVVNRWVN